MKKTTLIVSLLIVLLTFKISLAVDEDRIDLIPSLFKYKMGMTSEEVRWLNKEKFEMCDEDNYGLKKCFLDRTIGGYPLEFLFEFLNNKLVFLMVFFNNEHFNDMSDALQRKYGKQHGKTYIFTNGSAMSIDKGEVNKKSTITFVSEAKFSHSKETESNKRKSFLDNNL